MQSSLSVIIITISFFLLAFSTSSASAAKPTFTKDGQIRLKTHEEIEKEAKQSLSARRAEMKKQLENEISVTEAKFQAKKQKLEEEMNKKKSQMMERHEKLNAEYEKQSHCKQDLDEASAAFLSKGRELSRGFLEGKK